MIDLSELMIIFDYYEDIPKKIEKLNEKQSDITKFLTENDSIKELDRETVHILFFLSGNKFLFLLVNTELMNIDIESIKFLESKFRGLKKELQNKLKRIFSRNYRQVIDFIPHDSVQQIQILDSQIFKMNTVVKQMIEKLSSYKLLKLCLGLHKNSQKLEDLIHQDDLRYDNMQFSFKNFSKQMENVIEQVIENNKNAFIYLYMIGSDPENRHDPDMLQFLCYNLFLIKCNDLLVCQIININYCLQEKDISKHNMELYQMQELVKTLDHNKVIEIKEQFNLILVDSINEYYNTKNVKFNQFWFIFNISNLQMQFFVIQLKNLITIEKESQKSTICNMIFESNLIQFIIDYQIDNKVLADVEEISDFMKYLISDYFNENINNFFSNLLKIEKSFKIPQLDQELEVQYEKYTASDTFPKKYFETGKSLIHRFPIEFLLKIFSFKYRKYSPFIIEFLVNTNFNKISKDEIMIDVRSLESFLDQLQSNELEFICICYNIIIVLINLKLDDISTIDRMKILAKVEDFKYIQNDSEEFVSLQNTLKSILSGKSTKEFIKGGVSKTLQNLKSKSEKIFKDNLISDQMTKIDNLVDKVQKDEIKILDLINYIFLNLNQEDYQMQQQMNKLNKVISMMNVNAFVKQIFDKKVKLILNENNMITTPQDSIICEILINNQHISHLDYNSRELIFKEFSLAQSQSLCLLQAQISIDKQEIESKYVLKFLSNFEILNNSLRTAFIICYLEIVENINQEEIIDKLVLIFSLFQQLESKTVYDEKYNYTLKIFKDKMNEILKHQSEEKSILKIIN